MLDLPPRANLSVAEIAKFLHVSDQTVYDLIHLGEIHAKQIGRQYRIPRDRFLAWFEKSEVRSDFSPV